jgi:hypothetical protein
MKAGMFEAITGKTAPRNASSTSTIDLVNFCISRDLQFVEI